ncbi:MAG: hypothetical protein J7578_10170, partial [Chitinophagaceae bacterium]|nr:hypothetical protein [Chitinophagaceae bacterium]
VIYVLMLFFTLRINGVYGVASVTGGKPTTEGIDYKYEFSFEGRVYSGVFTDMKRIEMGDKYFVLFHPKDPDKNLLQMDLKVPGCYVDSVGVSWEKVPACK